MTFDDFLGLMVLVAYYFPWVYGVVSAIIVLAILAALEYLPRLSARILR